MKSVFIKYLSVTRMANILGVNNTKINPLLADLGYQIKEKTGWVPTEKGNAVCQVRTGTNPKGEEYTQVLWSSDVLGEMGGLMPPSREDYEALEAKFKALEEKNRRLQETVLKLQETVLKLEKAIGGV